MQPRARTAIAFALSVALAATTFGADKAKNAEKEPAPKYPVPAGLRGFDGTLGGNVVSVQDDMRGFVLKVTDILHSNTRSTAKDPKSAVGQEVEIAPHVTKDKNGHWVPDEHELDYIKSLQKGQQIQVDVINTDAHHLRISLLTKSERQQADKEREQQKK